MRFPCPQGEGEACADPTAMTANGLLLSVPIAAIAGLLCGRMYFAAMQRSVAVFVAGEAWMRPAALTLTRLAAAGAGFALAAWFGAAPLLAAMAGFLCARAIALRTRQS